MHSNIYVLTRSVNPVRLSEEEALEEIRSVVPHADYAREYEIRRIADEIAYLNTIYYCVKDDIINLKTLVRNVSRIISSSRGRSIPKIFAEYEDNADGFLFIFVNNDGAELTMSVSNMIADYGRFKMKRFHFIDWKNGYKFRITQIFDYHF